ncbi:hypothetical protein BGZ47_009561 [Haplosporangium gracile]|nr:hypothetical protein BGZ47_009561 [Haplosporangium gracile]
MAKDGFLTAKAIGNRIKAKGLQKLRWYCQICEKQCRDENGFKCHCASESHQRKILLVAESPEKYVNDYSAEFLKDFMKLLSTRYGTRRVNANLVYQEFIADRTHLHMNATKWATLSEFIMNLGKEGLAIVDETPKGWFLQWIDNSPKTLARQEAILKKERMELDDEQREQKLIQQQIDKAMALKQQQDEADGVTTELVRENEEEKIKLDISIKPVSLTGGIGGGGIKLGGGGLLKPKSLNALAAKKPNPFLSKSASTPTTTAASGNGSAASIVTSSAPTKKRSPVEEIMEREMAKKKRLEELNNNQNNSSQTSVGIGRSAQQPGPEKDRSKDSSRDDRDRDYRSSRDNRDNRDIRDRERERDYRSSRDDRDDRDRDYRSSRDSRDDRDRDRDRDYRSSRDDHDSESYRSSRDSRGDRDRDREYGSSSRDSRSDRDYRDRDRDSSHRDRGRD